MVKTIVRGGKTYYRTSTGYKQVRDKPKYKVVASDKFGGSSTSKYNSTPSVTSTQYKLQGKNVSKEEYDQKISELKEKDKEFTETGRVSSTGVTQAKEYSPESKQYFDVNPSTGVRRVTRDNYKVDGKVVSKEEYDRFVSKGLKEGKNVRVTRTKPVDVIKEEGSVEKKKEYWDWQKQLADKYSRDHPDMKTTEYFVSVKDDKSKIVGYEDKLSKQSVLLKGGESVSETSLKEASKRATALVNIAKGYNNSVPVSEFRSKESYLAEEEERKTKTKWWDFSSKLKESSKSSEQKYREAYGVSPLMAGVYAFSAFTSKVVKQYVDFPKNLATLVVGGLYATKQLGEQAVKEGVSSFSNIKDRFEVYERLTSKEPSVSMSEVLKGSPEGVSFVSSLVGGVGAGLILKAKDEGRKVLDEAISNPIGTAGDVVGMVTAPSVWGKAISTIKDVSTRVMAKIGLNYKDPSIVFAPETLAKGELPKTSSSAETLKLLEKTRTYENVEKLVGGKWVSVAPDEVASLPVNVPTRVVVSHISPAEFGKKGVFEAGPKGEAGLEDPVLFVTTKGHLSPLRIDSSTTEYSYEPFGWLLGGDIPKGYDISLKGGAYIPDEILGSSGFSDDLANFYASTVGDELAYVTKRSMIGKGEIKAQLFSATDDFLVPTQSLTVTRNGKVLKLSKGDNVKMGDIIRTSGTSEEELGIAASTSYVFGENRVNIVQDLLKAKSYTKYDGKIILLKEGRVLNTPVDDFFINTPIKESKLPSEVLIGSELLAESSKSVSSSVYSNIVYVDPSSSLSSAVGSVTKFVSPSDVSSSESSITKISISPSISSSVSSPNSLSVSVSESSILSGSDSVSQTSKSVSKSSSSSSSSSVSSPSSSVSQVSPSSSVSSPSGSSLSVSSSSSRVGSSFSPSSSIRESLLSPSVSNFKISKKFGGGLFKVKVRKSGNWVDVDRGSAFSFKEAHQKGMFEVGHSARASYKIERATGKKRKRFYGKGIFTDFYKKGNVFIEKRERRIKSRGEVEQISMKGQRAIKSKSIMGKMKLWGK